MATEKKILLYCFLLLNLAVVVVIVNLAGSYRSSSGTNSKMVTLTILNPPPNSQNLRGSRNTDFASEIAPELDDPESLPTDPLNTAEDSDSESIPTESFNAAEDPEDFLPSSPLPLNTTGELQNSSNLTNNSAVAVAIHPFERLEKRLTELGWDPVKIDEVIRKFWNTDRSFLRYKMDKEKKINTILSTSCLHTAAWIVTALLEMETRPNYYRGLYKIPENKDLIVYDNTDKPVSTEAAPVLQSIRNFIESQPKNESILLQVDMYQIINKPGWGYLDHHFAIHIYNGSINLYQGWQDVFNLIEWMQKPEAFKQRYPMPIETFLGHFAKLLTYSEEKGEFDRERLESIWETFGITETFKFGESKWEVGDPVVRALRFPWVVSLITHWPSPPQATELPALMQ